MKPYSVDFREKLIEVKEQEKVSIRQIANRFRVAKSWVQKIIKQYQETGNVKPQKQGGDYTSKLKDEHLIVLKEIIDENNDATQEELCDLLLDKTGIKISKSSKKNYIKN
jgi:transposase